MSATGKFLAIDIGASSGRHILGQVKDGKIVLEEVYRFVNSQVRRDGHDCWDIEALVGHVKAGVDVALAAGPITSIGLDTWGVDFVLLDEAGKLCSDAVAYRDARTAGADAEIERQVLDFPALYARTGIQKTSFNTIYQLWALKKEHPEQLEKARHFLTVPEYLCYRLTGNIHHEYTCSSTTALLDAAKRDWDYDLIARLGLPTRIFGKLEMPGVLCGQYNGVDVVMSAMHDTASAFLAVPARDDKAVYLSSGTWSLLGVENTSAITTPASCQANFTNEGGAWARYRYLKNIMGLWIVQSIRRELNGVSYVSGSDDAAHKAALTRLADYVPGHDYSFGELSTLARGCTTTASIDVDSACFMNPPSMIAAVLDNAVGTPPTTVGALMQCVYKSLAACYARAVKTLSALNAKTYTSLNIVGGGSQDAYLNELTAEATGLEVITGPVEATAIGNLIVQMVAAGVFPDLAAARRAIVR